MSARVWKWLLPVLLIVAGILIARWLVSTRPTAPLQDERPPLPLVEVQVAAAEDFRLEVVSHGSVAPANESVLAAQVSGPITWISPALRAGGFFGAGEALLRIDDRDYALAVVRAESAVAQAELSVAVEQNEAAVALEEWALVGEGDPDPLVTREVQLRGARAAVAAAEAALQRARLDLERTTISAPYDGRVRTRTVDVGQYLGIGATLASVYAIDAVEVRLPVPDAELAYLDLPLLRPGVPPGEAGADAMVRGPRVTLATDFAGRRWTWEGRIVRVEGEIDRMSRMLHLVVRVEAPYAASAEGRPPLTPGLFVEAHIEGREVLGAVALPRAAVRDDGGVLVVDADERLHPRAVSVLRAEPERVILADGVVPGERVVVSLLEAATDGMGVRVVGGDVP